MKTIMSALKTCPNMRPPCAGSSSPATPLIPLNAHCASGLPLGRADGPVCGCRTDLTGEPPSAGPHSFLAAAPKPARFKDTGRAARVTGAGAATGGACSDSRMLFTLTMCPMQGHNKTPTVTAPSGQTELCVAERTARLYICALQEACLKKCCYRSYLMDHHPKSI